MSLFKKVSVTFLILLLTLACWFFYGSNKKAVDVVETQDLALATVINQCDDITERAASHLVAVVEFQKLEIVGRKARVFKMCMRDHGYQENEHWQPYSMPIAKREAKTATVSVDAVLENLRRANMKVAAGQGAQPSYWVKKPAVKP